MSLGVRESGTAIDLGECKFKLKAKCEEVDEADEGGVDRLGFRSTGLEQRFALRKELLLMSLELPLKKELAPKRFCADECIGICTCRGLPVGGIIPGKAVFWLRPNWELLAICPRLLTQWFR